MTDGAKIHAEATEIAFPRYPGTDGDEQAIAWLERRFRAIGLQASLQWFTYDLRPAQTALRIVLVVGAVLVAGAGSVANHTPVAALLLLVAAVLPGMVFLAWSPWLERLYQRDGTTRTANVIGRRGAITPRTTLILMAHHDSKSQSFTLPFRMGFTITSIACILVLAILVISRIVTGGTPGSPWLAPAFGVAGAGAALALSTMRSGNRSPGGVDNAGSVAIMLTAAERLLHDLPDDVELIVLSTGAEEDHMIGAMRWLDDLLTDLAHPVFCLNFDGAGAPGRVVLIERYGFGRLFSAEMSAAAKRAAQRIGIEPRAIVMLPGMGIDAIPFAHRGVPCLTLASGSLGRATMSVHSANDRAEHLDPATLAEIADLAYETMMELANTVRVESSEL